jgi:hypothetical protein
MPFDPKNVSGHQVLRFFFLHKIPDRPLASLDNQIKAPFWPPVQMRINTKEARLIFAAYDEDGNGSLDRDELLWVLRYLDVDPDQIPSIISQIFQNEPQDFTLDEHTFDLWLRNQRLMRRRVSLREQIYFTLSDPRYCQVAFFTCGFILALIALTAVIQVLESMETNKTAPCKGCEPVLHSPLLETVDSVSMAIFTIEFFLRLFTVGYVKSLNQQKVKGNGALLLKFQVNDAPVRELLEKVKNRAFASKIRSFLLETYTIIDILAIFPYYIAIVLDTIFEDLNASDNVFMSVMKLVRTLRLMKLQKYSGNVLIFTKTLAKSAAPLFVLVFALALLVIVFGTLLFMLEQGTWHRPEEMCSDGQSCLDAGYPDGVYMRTFWDGEKVISPFRDILDASWCIILTITSVGFGDVYPVSAGGRFITTVAAIAGVLAIAMPITVLGNNFTIQYDAKMKRSWHKKEMALDAIQIGLRRMYMSRDQHRDEQTFEDLMDELTMTKKELHKKDIEQDSHTAMAELRATVRLMQVHMMEHSRNAENELKQLREMLTLSQSRQHMVHASPVSQSGSQPACSETSFDATSQTSFDGSPANQLVQISDAVSRDGDSNEGRSRPASVDGDQLVKGEQGMPLTKEAIARHEALQAQEKKILV